MELSDKTITNLCALAQSQLRGGKTTLPPEAMVNLWIDINETIKYLNRAQTKDAPHD